MHPRVGVAAGRDARLAGARVTAWLRDAIVSGRLPPTEPLSEPAVSRRLGVSRAPVREAFRQLTAERLLRVVPRVGTFIASMTPQDVEDVFDIRDALEVLALRLLPSRLRDADRTELAVGVEAARRGLADGQLERAGRLARGFHLVLVEKTRNRRLRDTFVTLTNELHWLRSADPPGRLRRACRDHVLIAEAILRGRHDVAERRVGTHLGTLRAAQLAQARQRAHRHLEGGRS